MTYVGEVADEITSEARSKHGHKNGSMARTFETLVPIMALFEPSNVEILARSCPVKTKRLRGKSGKEAPVDLYILWDELRPPIFGKKACYARKNVVEPVTDAFMKPFPTQVVVGPGTQQLILDNQGDSENKWSNCRVLIMFIKHAYVAEILTSECFMKTVCVCICAQVQLSLFCHIT